MTKEIHHVRISHLYEDLDKSIEQLKTDRSALQKSREIVEKALTDGEAYYGINTGFGILKNKKIDADQLAQLQRNLLLSHAVGVGDLIPKEVILTAERSHYYSTAGA